MCWQDYRIGAQLRQVPTAISDKADPSGSMTLPADPRRFGIIIHGGAYVQVRKSRMPGDTGGQIVFVASAPGPADATFDNVLFGSRRCTIDEFGDDLRGSLYIVYANQGEDGSLTVNELQYCGNLENLRE